MRANPPSTSRRPDHCRFGSSLCIWRPYNPFIGYLCAHEPIPVKFSLRPDAWATALRPRELGLAGVPCETSRFENPFTWCGRERASPSRVGSHCDSETGASPVPTTNDPDRTDCCRRSHNGTCRFPVGCFRLVVSSGPLRVSARNCCRTGEALDSLADVERPIRRNREWDGPRVAHDLLVDHGAQRKRHGVVHRP